MRNIEEHLLGHTSLDVDTIDTAKRRASADQIPLRQAIIESGKIEEVKLLKSLALFYEVDFIDAVELAHVDIKLIDKLPITFLKNRLAIPLYIDNETLVYLTSQPEDTATSDGFSAQFGMETCFQIGTESVVTDLINRAFASKSSSVELEENEDFEGDAEELIDIIDATDEAPIIRWVNSLIFQSVKERASDIHIEPGEREVVVRYRIDGVLYEVKKANKSYISSIVARIKIMSGLNIAEKRLPQDGRIRRRIAGKDIDMRVATVPTARGERITIRLLDKTAVVLDLGKIGLGSDHLSQLREMIRKPNGIMLVTGPTGSGKTTTLYASLSEINQPDKNILTIEDPVEYQLQGISQVQVNSKIDLNFSRGLRSFLRHDPDVIMVGEIRDHETAEIAIQASLTGHLVFSTLHTNDAPGAITRLVEMDVEPFLIASSVIGLMAQRLVRKVCTECTEARDLTSNEIASLGLTQNEYLNLSEQAGMFNDVLRQAPPKGKAFKPVGCGVCMGTGYSGRIGIYEVMPISDKIKGHIMSNAPVSVIKKAAVSNGMRTLRADGALKIAAGLTSIEEVMRVTQEDVD